MRKQLLAGVLVLLAAFAGVASLGGPARGQSNENLGLSSGWMRFTGQLYVGGVGDIEVQTARQGFQRFSCDARTLWKWADLGTGKQGILPKGYTVPYASSVVVRYRLSDAGVAWEAVRVLVYYRNGRPVTAPGE